MRSLRLLFPALLAFVMTPAFAEQDFFGLPATPKPAAAKPATTPPAAPNPGAPGAPAPSSELAQLAAKYKADTAALDTQKTAAVARVAQTYSTALDGAEKIETTAGRVQAIAAITKERADMKADAMDTNFPSNLPTTLRTARKNYLEGVGRADIDAGQRQQRLSVDYLRTLATLQTRAGSNSALAGQIAEEKSKIIAAAEGRNVYVGDWTFKGGGSVCVRRINADGTFIAVDNPNAGGKWKVSGKKLLLNWDDGGLDEFFFPINPKGTKGHAGIGWDFIATKETK